MKVKTELRDQILNVLENFLDTRDKRWMFIKLSFPRIVSRIQLEGSAEETAFNIFEEFERQGQDQITALIILLNSTFNTTISLTLLEADSNEHN